jgi:glycosyltransferase involved in cell wall biosynthesis
MTTAEVIVDARWIDRGGPGRITRNLLMGLVEVGAPTNWTVVGPQLILDDLVGAAFEVQDAETPASWRAGLEEPFSGASTVVHLHHLRPLRRGNARCVGMIYDTIPIRHARRAATRAVARSYLRRVAAVSDRVLTLTSYTRRCIIEDLGVSADRIDVLPLAIDPAVSTAIRAARGTAGVDPGFVFIGRSAPHKNITLLIEAHLAADTGLPLYLCTGGDSIETPYGTESRVVVVPRIGDDELIDRYLSTAVAVVQPSLEEGLGLPALEAAAGGVPVVASDIPALREIDPPSALWFDPSSLEELVAALRAASDRRDEPGPIPSEFALPRALAEMLLRSVEQAQA